MKGARKWIFAKILANSLAGGIVAGSFTVEPRGGNPGDVWHFNHGTGLNALGMPNGGVPYLEEHGREMVSVAHDAGKAFILNVAGFDVEEYAILAHIALEMGADAVELNLGCPNVVKTDGSRKPIPSFNLEMMEAILFEVKKGVGKNAPVWMKVSPYSDPELLRSAGTVVKRNPVVKAITGINTFPNAYGLGDARAPLISVGYAGLSGVAIKYIGLGQIKQWQEATAGQVELIAAGGIRSGEDIRDYETVGGMAFQTTTNLIRRGNIDAAVFETLAWGYSDIKE